MAAVGISQSRASFDGNCKIVPAGSQFVWLRFIDDKKWYNNFQHCMLEVWRSHNIGDGKGQAGTKARKATTAATGSAEGSDTTTLHSLGDIITNKWGCTSTHQVLARVFLSAERFEAKSNNLLFTIKDEEEFRRIKRARSVLLEGICVQKMEEPGSNQLRDWLNRIWVLFVTGIDNDPAGDRVLSYGVRKSVHDAQFSNDEATVLQASMLSFLIPSLKYDTCYILAAADFHASPLVKPVELTGFEASQRRSTPPQQQFVQVFTSFVGSFLDTLTEAEVVKAAAAFKPAIRDAQQRLLSSPKSLPENRKKSEDYSISKGDGIKIDHLDKLGHRKRIQKFA